VDEEAIARAGLQSLREDMGQHRRGEFEVVMLGRIFGRIGEEVTGDRKKYTE
jgi:hypothetical protein